MNDATQYVRYDRCTGQNVPVLPSLVDWCIAQGVEVRSTKPKNLFEKAVVSEAADDRRRKAAHAVCDKRYRARKKREGETT